MSDTTLTPDGARRRDAMLHELQTEMVRLHRRRRRRRTVVGVVLMATAAAAVAVIGRPRPPAAPVVAVAPPPPDPVRPAPRVVLDFDYVASAPGITERCAARGDGSIVIVDDDGLIAALAAIDGPTGLVRRGGRVWLTSSPNEGM